MDSARNSTFTRSVMSNLRNREKSRLPSPGPEKLLRPGLPKCGVLPSASSGCAGTRSGHDGTQPVVSNHVAVPTVPATACVMLIGPTWSGVSVLLGVFGADGGAEGQWPAGHQAEHAVHLPAAQDPTADAALQPRLALAERQFVDVALHESVGAVEIEARVAALLLDVVPESAVFRGIAQRMTPGVGGGHQEAAAEPAVHLHLQAVVVVADSRRSDS